MKKQVLTGAALGVLIAVLIAGIAIAEPFQWSFRPDSATVFGAAGTTSTMKSSTFKATYGEPCYIAAVVVDTGAGNGALTDSLIFALQKLVDLNGDISAFAGGDSSWVTVQALPAFDPTKAWGKQHYMSSDSIKLGKYPIGGLMRFKAYKGGGQNLDTLNCDVSINIVFEQQGKE